MNGKPEVVLEFEVADAIFVKPQPVGTPPLKDTLVLQSRSNYNNRLAIYVVLDGVVRPIVVPGDCLVELVVTK